MYFCTYYTRYYVKTIKFKNIYASAHLVIDTNWIKWIFNDIRTLNTYYIYVFLCKYNNDKWLLTPSAHITTHFILVKINIWWYAYLCTHYTHYYIIKIYWWSRNCEHHNQYHFNRTNMGWYMYCATYYKPT